MNITRPNTLILYFTAYLIILIHYFHNSKTRCFRQKPIAFLYKKYADKKTKNITMQK